MTIHTGLYVDGWTISDTRYGRASGGHNQQVSLGYYTQILKIEFGHDSTQTDRICNPTLTWVRQTYTTTRKYGPNPNCPMTWKVDVPLDQSFESWFTANVQYDADNYITTFTGAVG